MMKIKLSKEQKVFLLESVQTGTLDLNKFSQDGNTELTKYEILRELCRLECLEDSNFLSYKADLLKQLSAGEITREEYTNQILCLKGVL